MQNYISLLLKTSHVCPTFNGLETAWDRSWLVMVTLRLTDAGKSPIRPRDLGIWRCWMVSECSTVLLVAVKTAVTRWQLGALGKDQGGSPGDDPSDAEVPVWSVFRGELWRPRIAWSAVCFLTARWSVSAMGGYARVS